MAGPLDPFPPTGLPPVIGGQQPQGFWGTLGQNLTSPGFLQNLSTMLMARAYGPNYGNFLQGANQGRMQQLEMQRIQQEQEQQRIQQQQMEQYRRDQVRLEQERIKQAAQNQEEMRKLRESTQTEAQKQRDDTEWQRANEKLASQINAEMTPEQVVNIASSIGKNLKWDENKTADFVATATSTHQAQMANQKPVWIVTQEDGTKEVSLTEPPKEMPSVKYLVPKDQYDTYVKLSIGSPGTKSKQESDRGKFELWASKTGKKNPDGSTLTWDKATLAQKEEAKGWYSVNYSSAAGILVPTLGAGGKLQYTPRTQGAGAIPADAMARVEAEVGRYEANLTVKRVAASAEGIGFIRSIDPKSKNPADHMGIIYAFAKGLDPESVVREGEYATIKKYAQSLFARYGKEIEMAITGDGFLSERAIAEMRATLEKRYAAMYPIYRAARKAVGSRIKAMTNGIYDESTLPDYEVEVKPVGTTTKKNPFL